MNGVRGQKRKNFENGTANLPFAACLFIQMEFIIS